MSTHKLQRQCGYGGGVSYRVLLILALCSSRVRIPTCRKGMDRTFLLLFAGVAQVQAADSTTFSSSHRDQDRRERQRRREERDRRRQQSKPRPGRSRSSANANNKYSSHSFGNNGSTFSSSESFEHVSKLASNFFAFQPPRDVLEGTVRAIQSIFLGSAVGLVSLIGIPIIGFFGETITKAEGETESGSSRLASVIAGALLGGFLGTVSAVTGLVGAVFQVSMGLWNTFGAVKASHQGMRWDPRKRTWSLYYLEREVAELEMEGSSTTKQRSLNVQDTTYYDILGILSDATPKQIKRAYFTKAKTTHPDKSREQPEKAAAEFLKLHQAYQTLSDDQKRADYDKWGIHSSEGSGDGTFDPSVFFAVMFDFGRVESYIGELTIASFIDGLIKLGQMKSNLSDGLPPDVWESLWSSDADLRPRRRQVEIAQNILGRIQSYANGQKTAEEFRLEAQEEVSNIGGSSTSDFLGFMDKLLVTIGSALKLEAGRYLAFNSGFPVIGWPKGIFCMLGQKKNKLLRAARSVGKTVNLARSVITSNSDLTKDVNSTRNEGDGAVEEHLVDLLDMAGAYILQDIAKTLHGACWRLFYDTGVDSKIRQRRAKAVEILGEEFLNMSRKNMSKHGEKDDFYDPISKAEVVKEKILRAFELSQKHAA